MMIIGSHRIMIAKFLRYYNGLVLLFVRMGRPRSPGAEARGRCLSSSLSSTTWEERSNVRCGRWPSSSRPASMTMTHVHVLGIDLPPLPHRRHLLLLLYLLPLLHPLHHRRPRPPHCPVTLSSYRSSARLRHRRSWTTTRGAVVVVVVVAEAAAAAASPPCFIHVDHRSSPPRPIPYVPLLPPLKIDLRRKREGGGKEGG